MTGLDICHIGFVTKDMEKTLRRWLRSGANLIIPATEDPVQKVSCALIQCTGKLLFEIVSPISLDAQHPLAGRLTRGGGLDHICYFADDLGASIAQHVELGFRQISEPAYGCVFDRRIAFMSNPAGLVIELMSRSPEGRIADPLATSG